MAFVDGKHQGSSVTRALARHKLGEAQKATEAPQGHERGNGPKVEVQKMEGGGYHTISHHHDGRTEEADHQDLQQVAQHMGGHFGDTKHLREKNPKMKEKEPQGEQEPEVSHAMGPSDGLGALGVDGE